MREQQGVSQENRAKNPNELLESLNDYAKELAKSERGKETIPHLVLAHGFGDWQQLLISQFPAFNWRLDGELPSAVKDEREMEKVLYDRFFAQLSGMSTFDWLSGEEKVKLRERGWQAYLED